MDVRRQILGSGCKLLHWSGIGRLLSPLTAGKGLIFTLHSVRTGKAHGDFLPNRHLSVTSDFLEQTIEQVRGAGFDFVSLDEAVDRMGESGGRPFAALTFDDGYRNNLDIAYPVLKRHQVPFTIFVTSGFVDRTSEIWWEALERIVASAEAIEMPIGERMQRLPTDTPARKMQVFDRLLKWYSLDLGERSQRMEIRRLAKRHGLDLAALAEELILGWDDIRGLCADPLFSLGAHTHNHFALARLTRDDMRSEIRQGLERFQAELGIRPTMFAYPYGFEAAVNHQSTEAVREFGFRAAVTTHPGVLSGDEPLLELPRVSLNGYFQDRAIIAQYLTGAPFPVLNAMKRIRSRLSLQPACG
ncbi:polysaccharide deacetylase family protein [Stappia taiwanensis]|uniref:Chitooligosaccharide deacetylase n=1 Tax=Stappia taiwanensis TaxID=992267 RepID=A0A838XT30_9HYPH|nr:polysaccharide deacetylase family protein [Stappia taiwanensis]MBA4610234.1 polysaccharide deacetylase family protein [Stappia taiwanensis]GGE77952.1 hypothetical protein GCM10007285_02220 [Stappia taiwanensis]